MRPKSGPNEDGATGTKNGTWNSTSKNGGGSFESVIPGEDCNGETARKRTESMCLSVRREEIRFLTICKLRLSYTVVSRLAEEQA
jgi:hypothetical protein